MFVILSRERILQPPRHQESQRQNVYLGLCAAHDEGRNGADHCEYIRDLPSIRSSKNAGLTANVSVATATSPSASSGSSKTAYHAVGAYRFGYETASDADELIVDCLECRMPNLQVLKGAEFRSEAGIKLLKSYEPDYIICVHLPYFLLMLSNFKYGRAQPAHRPISPWNRSWSPTSAICDETPSSTCMHERRDRRGILSAETNRSPPDDTADSLYKRVLKLEYNVFKRAWPSLANFTYHPRKPQDLTKGTLHRKEDIKTIQRLTSIGTQRPRTSSGVSGRSRQMMDESVVTASERQEIPGADKISVVRGDPPGRPHRRGSFAGGGFAQGPAGVARSATEGEPPKAACATSEPIYCFGWIDRLAFSYRLIFKIAIEVCHMTLDDDQKIEFLLRSYTAVDGLWLLKMEDVLRLRVGARNR